jgi:hypothetical protein
MSTQDSLDLGVPLHARTIQSATVACTCYARVTCTCA